MKTKKTKIKSYRELFARIATTFGCSMTTAVILAAIFMYIIAVATSYLFDILWPLETSSNRWISAAFFTIFFMAILFIFDYFSLIERMDRWSWKSKKRDKPREN